MDTCRFVLEPVSQIISQIFDALDFAAQWAQDTLGIDWIDQISEKLDEHLKAFGLDRAVDSLQGGQIHFRADAADSGNPVVFPATAPSVDITGVFFGKENASFEVE